MRSDAVSNFRSSLITRQVVICRSSERVTMSRLAHLPLACIAACTLALSVLPSQSEPVARI